MAATLDVACPHCEKQLRVPAELAGKVIRCKNCQGMFEVPSESGTGRPVKDKPAPAKPVAAKPAKAKPAAAAKPVAAKPAKAVSETIPLKDEEPPPPPTPSRKYVDDDDDENPYGVTKDDLDVPRCPFCAIELDPPDTKICLNCGYDLLARRRHETKKVYENTFGDYAKHLGPGIACVLVIVALVTLNVICFLNMRDWLTGSMLDSGEKNKLTEETEFYLPPYCFNLWIGIFSAAISYACGKFAIKRLIFDWRPREKVYKK